MSKPKNSKPPIAIPSNIDFNAINHKPAPVKYDNSPKSVPDIKELRREVRKLSTHRKV